MVQFLLLVSSLKNPHIHFSKITLPLRRQKKILRSVQYGRTGLFFLGITGAQSTKILINTVVYVIGLFSLVFVD